MNKLLMQIRINTFLLGMMILLYCSPSAATSGNELLSACKSSDKFMLGYCHGFVQAEKYTVAQFPGMPQKCIDQLGLAEQSQLVDIAIKELESRPEQRHYSAHSIVFMAIVKSFGCITE